MSLRPEEKEMIKKMRRTMTIKETFAATGFSENTIQKYSKGFKVKRNSTENRNDLEILKDILSATKASRKGLRRTWVLNYANLSTILLKKYLQICISNHFLREEKGFYHITQRGNKFLSRFEDLMELFKSEKQPDE